MNRALVAAAVITAHAAPALTTLTPLRTRLLPRLSGVGDPGHVALTFDDGPDPASTPAFLDALAAANVRATFFLLGSMLEHAPWLGRELVAAGHEIGLHGHSHRILLARGPSGTHHDLTRGAAVVARLTGTPPRWYRPPYGVLTSSALRTARRLHLTPVLWTRWGRDWRARATPESVLASIGDNLGGATVLLHDSDCTSAPGSWRATLSALPTLLGQIAAAGLRAGPLREHGIGAR